MISSVTPMSTTANSKSHRDHPRSPLRLRHARRRPDHPGDQRRHSAGPTGAVRVQRADGLCGRPLRSYRTGATGLHGAHRPGRRLSRAAQPLRRRVLDQDVVWVLGGSFAGLLGMWHLHGVDAAVRAAWRTGVVLTGVSAGSICWHVGGTTDSFGPELRPVTDGLGLLPYANGVHYDSEEQRRPLLHRLVADRTLPTAYATDDGVGLHYRGTELVEALTEIPGKGAYRVERGPDGEAVETRLEPRLLS